MPSTTGTRPDSPAFIWVAGAIGIAFVLVLLGAFTWRDRRDIQAEAERIAVNTAALLAEHASRLVEASDFILREASELTVTDDGHIPADQGTHQTLQRLVEAGEHMEAIFVLGADGMNVVTSREWPVRPLSRADRPYFQDLRTRWDPANPPGLVIDQVDGNPWTSAPLIILARALPSGEGFRGVIGAAVSVGYFRRFYERVDPGYALSIALVRRDGLILVREPPPAAQRAYSAPVGAEGSDPVTGVSRGISAVDGVERIFAVQPVLGDEVWVRVGLAAADVDARWHARLRVYLTYGGVAVSGILALMAIALRWARREGEARARLEETNRTLEQRVQQRTADLSETNGRLEAALKDKEVLFREVHHRVKNNLQLVSSLLRLQSMRLEPDLRQGFEDSLSRIHSMSLVHELLYRSNQPSSVDFAAYLSRLAEHLGEAFLDEPGGIAIHVSADPVVLDLDTAIPLGLLANELVTNALKHAFPTKASGTVEIELRLRDGEMCLCIADDGIGMPGTGEGGQGLGTMLIRSLAAQLDAKVQAGPNGSRGTRHVIRLPRQDIAAPSRRPVMAAP